MMRKTKILITIGPSLENYETLKKALEMVEGVRFNISHSSYRWHKKMLKMVREIEKEIKKPITVVGDTRGFEIRVKIKKPIIVKRGHLINPHELGIPTSVIKKIKIGQNVLMEEGKVKGVIVKNKKIKVLCDGILHPNKKLVFPGLALSKKFINEQDKKDFKFFAKNDFDVIALSFVKTKRDVEEVKRFFEKINYNPKIVSKIEHKTAVKNLEDIVKVSDGIMVARGDLALETSFEHVPIIQQKCTMLARKYNRLVIVATQMLESMKTSPYPSRAEVNDIANTVLQGADCLMLSDETAVGEYPLEAITAMVKIIKKVERLIESKCYLNLKDRKNLLAKAAIELGKKLKLPIVAPTMHGTTPSKLSSMRPSKVIYALTPVQKTYKFLNLYFGVFPILYNYEPLVEKRDQIKKLLKVEKCIFVFGYPPGNKDTNVIMIG